MGKSEHEIVLVITEQRWLLLFFRNQCACVTILNDFAMYLDEVVTPAATATTTCLPEKQFIYVLLAFFSASIFSFAAIKQKYFNENKKDVNTQVWPFMNRLRARYVVDLLNGSSNGFRCVFFSKREQRLSGK